MKLVSYTFRGRASIGVVRDDHVIDVSCAVAEGRGAMIALLDGGRDALERAREIAARGSGVPLARVTLLAPVPRPGKYLAHGLNYRAHAAEAERKGIPTSRQQVGFNKQTTCVTGPFAPIELPAVSDKLDYEGELALVIGTRCRHVRAEHAPEVIAGYLVANDVSVRDWQMRVPTWTLGKSFDTHGPLGPWLVTADEVGDPHALTLRTWVNGELRQMASTADMIHSCFAMIEHLSTVMTLEPGDVIATGTPAGIGAAREPPQYLRAGDVVRVEIERLGALQNTVVTAAQPGRPVPAPP